MDEGIASFNAVTGNENVEVAKFYLDSSENNVEAAINTYMENGGAAPADLTNDVGASDADAEAASDAPKLSVSAEDKGDEEQRWYTGGPQGGSGQEVIAPGQGNDMMNSLMQDITPHARQGTSDDLGPAKGAFTGSARTLDGQVKSAPKEPKKVVVKLFANEVFTVDDGPPRNIYDSANTAFLESIRRQEVPPELRTGDNVHISLSLMQIAKDYDAADFPKPAFQGTGQRLDDGAPSTSGQPPSQARQPVSAWNGPDESQPVTSIQIRMPDGARLIGRFNLNQKIHEIRAFVAAARPTDKAPYQMLAGFPQTPVPDESATIDEGGLKGSVVVFK